MSLINQMLRDLQQHDRRPDADAPPVFPAGTVSARRPVAGGPVLLGRCLAGLAALALLWALAGWLADRFTPATPAGAPVPGQIASVPAPSQVTASPMTAPAPAPAEAPPSPAAVRSGSMGVDVARRSQAVPETDRQPELMSPGEATPLHPDQLPGAVPSTIPPRFEHPYRQADLAYREAQAAERPEVKLAALQRALLAYPGHMPARELLAGQLAEAGRRDEALAVLEEGLRIVPDYTPLRKQGARLLLDGGDPAGAARLLIGPGLPRVTADPELHKLLANAYEQLGEPFLAAQTYRNLLVNAPRDGLLWVGLATVLERSGQGEEARRAYRQALAVGGLTREEAARARAGSGGT